MFIKVQQFGRMGSYYIIRISDIHSVYNCPSVKGRVVIGVERPNGDAFSYDTSTCINDIHAALCSMTRSK